MNEAAIESGSNSITMPRRRLRNGLYAISWVFFFLWIYRNYQGNADTAAVLVGLVWALCLTLWCRIDAILAERPLPTLSLWVVFLFWPIAVPICVIRIYGVLYGLLLVFLHLMIYAIAYAFPAVLTMMEQY